MPEVPGSPESFGWAVDIDGDTVVVSDNQESSSGRGVDAVDGDASAPASGAVYVLRYEGASGWVQRGFIKAPNSDEGDGFGRSVAISGNMMIVGASGEDGTSSGIDGDQSSNAAPNSGAAYLYRYDGVRWVEESYIKASNRSIASSFGTAVDVSADTVVVSTPWETSGAVGIDGSQTDASATNSGAVYLFH